MKDDRCVILLRESLLESVLSDLATLATVVGIIGIGRYLDSAAMQWCGFLMLCVIALGRVGRVAGKGRMAPQAAADLLLEKYGVVGIDEP
jgi:hypothetical protein